ncbi:MAG: aminotransferase class V-fold PLP-dependent enzyme [Anaerolineae bacterium]|nr:aminotransferase class V-fold PLP-dependent enzyme [Anaerolineae bacterium]
MQPGRNAGQFDPVAFRALFPTQAFDSAVYLDNAATTLTPASVVETLTHYYTHARSTAGRSAYRRAAQTTQSIEAVRTSLMQLLRCPPDYVLVFCPGATAAINMVAWTIPFQHGDNVVVTVLEHHANLLPWWRCRAHGVTVRVAPTHPDGRLDVADVVRLFDQRTRLMAVTHMSNVLGMVPPVAELCAAARRRDILSLVDGTQALGHLSVDLAELGCDIYVASAHKAYGPTGVGLLALSPRALEILQPPILGGGAVAQISGDTFTLQAPPHGWEAGTPPIAEILGWGASLPVLQRATSSDAQAYVAELTEALVSQLHALPAVTVYGAMPAADRYGTVSFNVDPLSPHRVAALLDEMYGVMVRSGEHCASLTCREVLGVSQGTVRVSLAPYNTPQDIATLVEGVRWVAQALH